MKAECSLAALSLSDHERVDHIPMLIHELAAMLDSEHPDQTSPDLMRSARDRGETRFHQGYSMDMLLADSRMFVRAVNDVIQE
jgi:hypothetical protein